MAGRQTGSVPRPQACGDDGVRIAG